MTMQTTVLFSAVFPSPRLLPFPIAKSFSATACFEAILPPLTRKRAVRLFFCFQDTVRSADRQGPDAALAARSSFFGSFAACKSGSAALSAFGIFETGLRSMTKLFLLAGIASERGCRAAFARTPKISPVVCTNIIAYFLRLSIPF